MGKILIVEDSMESFELARRALGTSSQVDWVKSIQEATKSLDNRSYDLVLLDIGLPDGDGFHLCSLMQTHQDLKNVAVIFLSARSSVPDKIMGFSVGADDFLAKPFDPVELKARVDAKLRRRDRDKAQAQVIHAGDLEINKDSQRVTYLSEAGATVDLDLTPIEFKILLHLANRADHVHSRDEVLTAVWGEGVFVYARCVDTHVSKLRKKMGTKSSYIQSVHGCGYRFSLDEYRGERDAIPFSESRLSAGIK